VGKNLAIGAIAALSVAAGLVAPGVANATVEKFDFSGSYYDDGATGAETLFGSMLVNVNGAGLATSGTATVSISGASTVGPVTMRLALPDPPNSAYEAGDGTELPGNDNMVPIDNNGITFGTNAPSGSGGYVFQIVDGTSDGGCGTAYCGFFGGPGSGHTWPDNHYGLAGLTTFTQSAVPEPSTWAMLMVGFGGLGFAAFRRGRRVSAFVA
jgi:PEP-CTERM motif-containing protein